MANRRSSNTAPYRGGPPHRRGAAATGGASVGGWLISVALGGLVIGSGSVAATPEGRAALVAGVKPIAVPLGIMRARAPEAGDHWRGCNDARAAGTAPIYRGEPGFRAKMDGDGDGIACEPYR